MLSIVMAAAKDPHLQRTVDEVREKAKGEIEVVVVLDGYEDNITGADTVVKNKRRLGLRSSINRGMEAAEGEWLLKCDSHCAFDEGFDVKLLSVIADNWVVVPRRYKLDVDKWEVMWDDGYIDYDRLLIDKPDRICGVHWNSRRDDRKDIAVDETMVMQGSCYVMSRNHWNWLGGLSINGYGSFAGESTEVALKTWLGGGRVMVNKTTWYGHKHRKFKRCVNPDKEEVRKGNLYCKDYWLNNRWPDRVHDLQWLYERFGVRYNPNYETEVL